MAGTSSVNLDALVTNLGEYCREHKDTIFTDHVMGLDAKFREQGITIETGIADEVPLVNFDVADIVRPGDSKNFDPKVDAITFDNRLLKVRPFKVDLQIDPQDFERKWITHSRRMKGTMKEFEHIPFHAFIIKKVIEMVNDGLRRASWKGSYNAAGTGVLDICDGWIVKLIADVAANNIDPVTTGNVTAANVLAKVEAVLDAWGAAYQDMPGIMKCSPTVFKYYARMTEAVAGRSLSFEELNNGGIQLRGSNVKLVKVNELAPIGGIEPLILTPTGNFIAGTDSQAELNQFTFQKNHRLIDLMLDGKWGVDYALANTTNDPIVVNDAFA